MSLEFPEARKYVPYSLRKSEKFWVKYQIYLLSQGYQLRSRYHTDWIPSWLEKDGFPLYHEDSRAAWVRSLEPRLFAIIWTDIFESILK